MLQINGESESAIAFRTDIDALPYRLNDQLKVLHACGHDVHMTILTGLILKLKALSYKPKHTLKFIFQPAEELGEGAKYIVEEEQYVFNNVDYLFGMHVRPSNELKKASFLQVFNMEQVGRFIWMSLRKQDMQVDHGNRLTASIL